MVNSCSNSPRSLIAPSLTRSIGTRALGYESTQRASPRAGGQVMACASSVERFIAPDDSNVATRWLAPLVAPVGSTVSVPLLPLVLTLRKLPTLPRSPFHE